MDAITKIIEQILNLIKNLLASFGVNTDKVDEMLDEIKGEEDTTEPTV